MPKNVLRHVFLWYTYHMKRLLIIFFLLGPIAFPAYSLAPVVSAQESEYEQSAYYDQEGVDVLARVIQKMSSPVVLATIMVVFSILLAVGAYVTLGIVVMLFFMRR